MGPCITLAQLLSWEVTGGELSPSWSWGAAGHMGRHWVRVLSVALVSKGEGSWG